MQPYTLVWILLFTAALAGGCQEQQAPRQGAPKVTYMTVAPSKLTLTTELSGRTSAFNISDVRPQVTGIIQKRLFTEGSDVKAGEILYQIDPAQYQAAYDNAKASLMKAESNVPAARLLAERYAQLLKVNGVSKQEHDNAVASFRQAEAEVAAARAALETARINLDYTKLTSPISGRIGRSQVTEGALVTQNQPQTLATVQQLDPLYVDVTQSSADLLRLRRAFEVGALKSSGEGAMLATLRLEDGSLYGRRVPRKPGAPLSPGAVAAPVAPGARDSGHEIQPILGSLKFSDVTVDQSTGMITIRAIFPNPDGVLLPGMYVRASLEEGVSETAILVPQKAVIRDNRGRPIANVLVKNATIQDVEGLFNVQPRVLTVNRSVGNDWLVTDGLQAGDKLLLEGVMKVRAGMAVQGTPDAAAAGDAARTAAEADAGVPDKAAGGKAGPAGDGKADPMLPPPPAKAANATAPGN